jgi:hypothetical protein
LPCWPTQVRDELSFAICQPILHPERFEALGLAAATVGGRRRRRRSRELT